MIVVPCLACFRATRVMDPAEVTSPLVGEGSPFWPDKYPCPSCGQLCRAVQEDLLVIPDLQRFQIHDLSAMEAAAAFEGLGMPDEMICDMATVTEIFQSKKVKKVVGQTLRGTSRSTLEEIHFTDGTRLFLGSGPSGAVVYRIARSFSYVGAQG